jgi:predicted DCC family thiol-disulfide oxidoreductase YuxK
LALYISANYYPKLSFLPFLTIPNFMPLPINPSINSQIHHLPDMPLDSSQIAAHATPWQIKLLFDGECPLCVREVNFLRNQDGDRGLVKFVDIAADDYDPADNANIDYATAMGRIHGILADGTILQNVAVFRYTYDVLGIGWVYAITKHPAIAFIADRLYGIWADYRLLLTGRGSLQSVLAERQRRLDRLRESSCQASCQVYASEISASDKS